MRMITSAANANLAAVNYHFGSKDALVQAVFRRRLTALNQERLTELDRLEAEAGGATIKPSRIVEAFFGTALRMAAERAFLKRLDGSCQTPIAGLAELDGDRLHLRGEILRPDGSEVNAGERVGAARAGAAMGTDLANELRGRAAADFFDWG